MSIGRARRAHEVQAATYVDEGRKLIGEAELTVPKRERLLGCLNAFQAELDRERTGLQVFGPFACELFSIAGEAAGKLDPTVRIVERIGKALGWSRQAEEERERGKQRPAPDTERLASPLKRITGPKRLTFDKKIDDEIPFWLGCSCLQCQRSRKHHGY